MKCAAPDKGLYNHYWIEMTLVTKGSLSHCFFVGRLRMSQQEEEQPRVLEMKCSQAA